MDNNTFVGNIVDRGPWQLYDQVTLAAAAAVPTTIQPFSVPISGTKTKLATNLTRANMLAGSQAFLLMGLGFYFAPNVAKADIDTFLNNGYFEFRIDQKIYHEGPLWMYPAGLGLWGATTQTAESAWQNGSPYIEGIRSFGEYARVIADNQQFTMQITFPAGLTMAAAANGGTGMNLYTFLDGVLDRTVQ